MSSNWSFKALGNPLLFVKIWIDSSPLTITLEIKKV